MKYLYAFILLTGILSGCKPKEDMSGVPSYLHIEKTSLKTDTNSVDDFINISDCWISENEQILGSYEYPVNVPILDEGRQFISIAAGVKADGIGATRSIYPFYDRVDTFITLNRGRITNLNPVFHYSKSAVFQLKEKFEGAKLSIDTASGGNTAKLSLSSAVQKGYGSSNGRCLEALLTSSNNFLSLSSVNKSFPFAQGAAVWAEISYNSDAPFVVGIYNYPPAGSTNTSHPDDIVQVNSSGGAWKKIYVNFTDMINSEPNGSVYTFYIYSSKANDGNETNHIYLDNIKILTF